MDNEILALLRVHEYFLGIGDDALKDVLALAKARVCAAGEIVHQPEDSVTFVGFILKGRLKAVRVDAAGRESLFRMMERGGQMGMMLGALQEPVPVRVVALEPSVILLLNHDDAMELSLRHPALRRLWLKTYAGTMRKDYFGLSPVQAPKLTALIHHSPESRHVGRALVERLRQAGESVAVLSDFDDWKSVPDVRFRQLMPEGQPLAAEAVQQQVSQWQDATRILFEVNAQSFPERTQRLLHLVDRAVYVARAADGPAVIGQLNSLDVVNRGWRDKLCIAWLLETGRNVGPRLPNLDQFVSRDFKLGDTPPQAPWGRTLQNGLERLVHELRGIRIGIALGGGAARGMSHLGVLKALEDNGIAVDMIAGTSAGAMSGVVYASGLAGDYGAAQFANDLQPSWLFRHIPRGNHWYLFTKYRRGQFDPMLRKYLHDWTLEELPIPCVSVTVDLVHGCSVVRARGDAVHAILESINLPVLSVPICRNGQALIDGGVVNNIPADVLVAAGCNFVIAVSVTAKLEKRFANITPDGKASTRPRPSSLQTILRSLLVQNYNMNAIGVQPADIVIDPDVTGFELTDFMKAKELAAIGEQTALERIPRIRQLLSRLDPGLFPAAPVSA